MGTTKITPTRPGCGKRHKGRWHLVMDAALGGFLALHFAGHLLGVGLLAEGAAEAARGTQAVKIGHPAKVNAPPSWYAKNARVCFPAKLWNAPDRLRPCARVLSVIEDGSLRIAVLDASGVVRYEIGVGVPDRYEDGLR